MAPAHTELERLTECLRGLIAEHRRLLDLSTRQEAAMRAMNLSAIETIRQQQDESRGRILQFEARRRMAVTGVARAARISGDPTLGQIAVAFPPHRAALLGLRDELRRLAAELKQRNTVTARIAQAMLGHLNTAVRLLASAVERGGTYTKQGTPKLTRRMGTIEAVG